MTLLESLLEFFDRFSEENSKDIRIEAAVARQRVGDIQNKLGQLQKAEESYRKALDVFAAMQKQDPTNHDLILKQVTILNELLVVYAKQGQLNKSTAIYREARRLLESSKELAKSEQGRFTLAKLLNSVGTIGSKLMRPNRARPIAARLLGNVEAVIPQSELIRLKREAEFNAESLGLMRELVKERPDDTAYQLSLARSLKDEVRIARMMNEIPKADETLREAIAIFQTLSDAHPESSVFQYELADTLATTIAYRPIDRERCEKALEICEVICKQNPLAAEYKALKAATLFRLGQMPGRINRNEELFSEAIAIQEELAEKYSDVATYRIAVAQSHFQMAEMYLFRKQLEKARASIEMAIHHVEKLSQQNQQNGIFMPYVERLRERRAMIEKRISTEKP